MTSSNGNIFRVTGPLWGESTGHKGQWREALMFSLICAWTNGLNNLDAGNLRPHHRDELAIWIIVPPSMLEFDRRIDSTDATRDACQISEQSDNSKPKSCGLEIFAHSSSKKSLIEHDCFLQMF